MARHPLGVLFGGKSNEYEVSLLSAAAVLPELDRAGIPRLALRMDRDGRLFLFTGDVAEVASGAADDPTSLSPADFVRGGVFLQNGGRFFPLSGVFPAVHGGMTEDGRLQGMLDLLGIPYAGSGAEACAVTMNKALTKALLSSLGVPTAGGLALTIEGDGTDAIRRVEATLPYPVFVKPARSGSSVGAGIARNHAALYARITDAKKTDRLVLFEPLIVGREIEVAVLSGEDGRPVASPPGELFFEASFYDYETKYGVGAKTRVPADLPASLSERLRRLALTAFGALGCRHYARVDFFVTDGGKILLNEVNALPGLTGKSMFPRLAAAMGIPFPVLVRRLAAFAVEGTA